VFAVVNTMSLARPIEPEVLTRMQAEMMHDARNVPGFVSASFIGVAEDTAVMVVVAETAEAVRELHETVGSPWIGANLTPYLTAADRKVGPVLASTHLP
jgi:hypothetical protein